eukprot:442296_1
MAQRRSHYNRTASHSSATTTIIQNNSIELEEEKSHPIQSLSESLPPIIPTTLNDLPSMTESSQTSNKINHNNNNHPTINNINNINNNEPISKINNNNNISSSPQGQAQAQILKQEEKKEDPFNNKYRYTQNNDILASKDNQYMKQVNPKSNYMWDSSNKKPDKKRDKLAY